MQIDHLSYPYSRSDFNRLTLTKSRNGKLDSIRGTSLNAYVAVGDDPVEIIRDVKKTKKVTILRIYYVPKVWLED